MKTSTLCIRFFLTTLAAALLLVAPARAAAPAGDPAPALLATINGVLDLVAGQTPDSIGEKVPAIRAKMDESFATEAIVRRAFGRNWAKLTPAQQKEVVDLLGRVIIRTYATQLSSGTRPVIAVTASRSIAPDRWEVLSTATRDGKSANVIYRFAPFDGKWKVYDVLAENVSVVGNYRQQFDAHFQTKDAEDLLKNLRAKLAAPVPAADLKQ
jgi:phospholipid transport system substrate-binding protein